MVTEVLVKQLLEKLKKPCYENKEPDDPVIKECFENEPAYKRCVKDWTKTLHEVKTRDLPVGTRDAAEDMLKELNGDCFGKFSDPDRTEARRRAEREASSRKKPRLSAADRRGLLPTDAKVKIGGLTDNVFLNGRRGIVKQYDDGRGMYIVEVRVGEDTSEYSVARENMRLMVRAIEVE